MKGESKVDTTPSETFEDVMNESENEDRDEWGRRKDRVKVDTTPSETFEDVKKEADESEKELNRDTIDEEWKPEKKGTDKRKQLENEITLFLNEHGDLDNLSKEEAYELGKMYAAKAAFLEDQGSTLESSLVSAYSKELLDRADAMDKLDNAYKPEFKNDSTNIADIKKAAEQTGADPETVKAIAGAPKFIQTIESKLGDLLLKMGRRAARYNPLTLAVALYESVKNGEGMEKSIDKAIDALGLERDSMSQDEYDALYKEIEGLRSSIDRGDFKISLSGRGPAAATSDATPTDFFDGLLNTDKTDYSGYNAGLKASDTASDKDTKEIIVRVYKKDPVLRLLKC